MPPVAPGRRAPSKIINKFRGLSQFANITRVPLDHALDLLNVFVSASGALEKMRLPIARTTAADLDGIIDSFYDFQQANGTRQTVVNWLNNVGYFTVPVVGGVEQTPWVFTAIERVNNGPRFSWVDSNNVLFGANGARMMKWNGSKWYNWGIKQPAAAPGPQWTPLSTAPSANNITRAANVVTFSGIVYFAGLTGAVIRIGGCSDPSFNGQFVQNGTLQWPQVGANFTASDAVIYGSQINGGILAGNATRINGIVTLPFDIGPGISGLPVSTFSQTQVRQGATIVVTACADASFLGTFILKSVVWTSATTGTATWEQLLLADAGAIHINAGQGNNGQVFGTMYGYSYASTINGGGDITGGLYHVGPMSAPSGVIKPPFATPGGHYNIMAGVASDDPQVDAIVWWRTQDGGGDFFKLAIVPYVAGTVPVMWDGSPDNDLDFNTRAPLINFPPPAGDKIAKFGNRLFVAGINGATQDVAYSALETVLIGRPEESFYPNNRLRLSIGADDIRAFAPILPGMVIWSRSNQMYIFKGTIEDITGVAPVNLLAVCEELPWSTGAISHKGVKTTPQGVCWIGADYSVKLWNGIFYGEIIGPRDLTKNIYPLMRRITPGTAQLIQTEYFNFAERDWFCMLLSIDKSVRPNRIVIFDLAPEEKDNLGIFMSDIQADAIGVREDINGLKHLTIAQGTQLWLLRTASTAISGVVSNPTSTGGRLFAYWDSGYEGGESSRLAKFWRIGNLITDNPEGFNVLTKIQDDQQGYTFKNPRIDREDIQNGKFTINWKGKRCGVTIIFPTRDEDCTVDELSLDWNPTSSR